MHKIKTALLSYGSSGKLFHASFLTMHNGFELIGAWERTKNLIANDYPSAKTFRTIDEVLSSDASLVIVNTPTATHFEYAMSAMAAGKDVVVEKAFTANASEAEALRDFAQKNGRKISVFHNRRFDSDFLTVKQVLAKQLLGEIVEAEIHFDRYNPALSPKIHKETVNPGAGIIKDLGSHIIDQALVLFGFPDAVYADIRYTRKHTVVDDWFDLTLYYQDFRVRLKGSYLVREPLPAYVIHGTTGSFLKPRADIQEDDLRAGKMPSSKNWGEEPPGRQGILHTTTNGKTIREFVKSEPGNYRAYFDALHDYLTGDAAAPVSASDGVNVMRIIDAAFQSDEQKTIIYFDI